MNSPPTSPSSTGSDTDWDILNLSSQATSLASSLSSDSGLSESSSIPSLITVDPDSPLNDLAPGGFAPIPAFAALDPWSSPPQDDRGTYVRLNRQFPTFIAEGVGCCVVRLDVGCENVGLKHSIPIPQSFEAVRALADNVWTLFWDDIEEGPLFELLDQPQVDGVQAFLSMLGYYTTAALEDASHTWEEFIDNILQTVEACSVFRISDDDALNDLKLWGLHNIPEAFADLDDSSDDEGV
ncbi:hypothetical protein C8Q80DRAFT_1265659 [Daedaleopsis nitida]|nr:hypothetical protein C8Q80DRAFT_1273581 [Daedaleopsis nitida]KAI0757814.1 hypothetical protein C8Q80DRAFT_1265659 [Daedaleopsis nitida]